jgi:hypothetical protein
MLLIGEGTAEIQKMIIGRRLVEDDGITALDPPVADHGDAAAGHGDAARPIAEESRDRPVAGA